MTADRSTLAALVARCEQATGPDEALDREIAVAAGHAVYDRGKLGWTFRLNGTGIHLNVPRYTASLDAALTLVPEGWGWSLHSAEDTGPPCAYCVPRMKALPWPDIEESHAATPALALVAAALRARMEAMRDAG